MNLASCPACGAHKGPHHIGCPFKSNATATPPPTPPDITETDLAAIEQRANAATPGPWHNDDAPWKVHTTKNSDRICTCGDEWPEQHANGTFIAASRVDVPRLVAVVRSRDAEIVTLKLSHDKFYRAYQSAKEQLARAVAALRRVAWTWNDPHGYGVGSYTCRFCEATTPGTGPHNPGCVAEIDASARARAKSANKKTVTR